MGERKLRNIFEISEEYLYLIEQLEENGGELTPELEERLKITKDDLEQKIKAYHHIITVNTSDAVAIDLEIERLNKVKKVKANTIERLKDNLLQATLMFGYDGKSGNKKLDYDTLKLFTQNTKSVLLDDEENFEVPAYTAYNISSRFTKTEVKKIEDLLGTGELKTTKFVSKEAIKKAIEQGETVNGASVLEKPHLRIK